MHAGSVIKWHLSIAHTYTLYTVSLFAGAGVQHEQVPGWQMQWQNILGMVSIPKQLIDTYLRFRQLLGNDVRRSHEAWEELQTINVHPLLKVAGLAFGVISTPETSSYMEQQWGQLRKHMDRDSPDAKMARAMMDYALAWAYHLEDLEKALKIVKAFYEEMENGDSSNFFLAPCYTVTIGRWIYDANNHCLSYQVIEEVKEYAYKTLRQLKTLKDEWAIIDTFGMNLNAMVLLLRVKEYYTDNSLSVENLERDIEDLIRELQRFLSHPKITTYDKAGFYSVRKGIFKNVNNEEFCRCAKKSAELFRKNGRIRRALEEAQLSDDKELVQELLEETQDIPSGESDPHEEPEPATVKGECRVAVCLSMLVPTTNMRRGDADMLHHSLPTLTTTNVSLVCLYLCIQHILDHHDGTVARECGYLHSVHVCAFVYVRVCVCVSTVNWQVCVVCVCVYLL